MDAPVANTPMMRQYQRIRRELPPDVILLFRLGDFYEMFFEDAKVASAILNVTLTRRQETPMCGVPFHASDHYIGKLVQAGMTDYDEPQPLLSLTTFSYSVPQNVGANNFQIDTPDASKLPIPAGDWQWLRGGDDLQRQDKLWRLQQSWTGFLPGNDRNSLYELLYDT